MNYKVDGPGKTIEFADGSKLSIMDFQFHTDAHIVQTMALDGASVNIVAAIQILLTIRQYLESQVADLKEKLHKMETK